MKNNSLTNDQKEQLAYLEVRLFNARSNYEIEKTMVDIIKLIPNDYDLGTYIRSLFNQNQPLSSQD